MKILETIKALLAKAASSDHAEEADAFAAKAHELMAKYQIDADKLGEAGDEIGRDYGYATKQKSAVWQNYVASATASYFGCSVVQEYCYEGVKTAFIGRESARITAMEMLPYFIKTINALARDIVAADLARGFRAHQRATANRVGLEFAARLRRLVAERAPTVYASQGVGLVKVDQQKAMRDALYPHLTTARATKFTTTANARNAAAGISLARQATGTRNNLQLA